MSDITMCKGGKCRLRTTCWRYLAPVNEHRQAYFTDPPYHQLDACEQYWKTEPVKRTPNEWMQNINPGVKLADGLEGWLYDDTSIDTPITMAEFEQRLDDSMCVGYYDIIPKEVWPRCH